MKNIPNKIYLQIGEKTDLLYVEDFKELNEMTWCEDRINDTDIVYYRKKKNAKNQKSKLCH